MLPDHIIAQLEHNTAIFKALFGERSPEEYRWQPPPGKWCLLEIACHLYDEEREDFRARLRHVLETPDDPMPPINPVGWVQERRYIEQDYEEKVGQFLEERQASAAWLRSLADPPWDNTCHHPTLGAMSGRLFLSNWLAHDYLHIRQITRLLYARLEDVLTDEPLNYAGDW